MSAGVGRRDLAWLRRHVPEDADCTVTEVTAGEAVIAVMGPQSRELLQAVTPDDLSNAGFAFATAREIAIGCAPVRAHRISYVGELGWELYVGADMARHVFDVVAEAGAGVGLRLCGMHVLDTCRLEKAFRHFGHDISDEDHVEEAGLGFAVKADKPAGRLGDFIGRAAVLAKRQAGLTRRLLQFRLSDPQPLLYHNEPVWRDGRLAGRLTSGGYGHHLGAAVGLGYVTCEAGESGADVVGSGYEIEVAGVRVAAEAGLRPMYDPKGERVRG
jgi:4-methylaminobutanoate oxidase (formaldehyde-forming)